MSVEEVTDARWYDSHCHLHDEDEPAALFKRAREHGVERIVLVGTDEDSSARAIHLARLLGPDAVATIGLHPHEASSGSGFVGEMLRTVRAGGDSGERNPVVGIGECGLDYYYEHSDREHQRAAFTEQIALATSASLTLVVHTRDAWDDTLAILRSAGTPERTIIHCFTGGVDEARACLDLGAYLSFSGIVTFKNAADVREAAQYCPLDRILVETDAPYLAPVPHRGERNQPAYVSLVGEALASVRGISPSELGAATRENTARAFELAA